MTEYDIKENKQRDTCGGGRVRVLLVLLVFALLAAVITLGVLYGREKKRADDNTAGDTSAITDPTSDDVCLSEDCVTTAANIIQSLNREVKPCDNFFDFACGGWIAKHEIPDDLSRYNTFDQLRDQVQVTLREVLASNFTADEEGSEISATRKSKILYASCVNEETVENEGAQPLLDAVLEVFETPWAILEQEHWDDDTFDLVRYIAKLRAHNSKVLVNFWSGVDDRNSTVNVLQVDQPGLGMPGRDYYTLEKYEAHREAYRELFIGVAKMLNSNLNTTALEQDVDAVIAFETQVAKATVPAEDRRDFNALYNEMTLRQLQENTTGIPFKEIITESFRDVAGIEIPEEERLINYVPSYFLKLQDILAGATNRTKAIYLQWRFIKNRLTNLGTEFRALNLAYRKVIYGTQSERARWITCTNFVNSELGMATGKLYVNQKFDEESKSTALEMIAGIRKTFNDLLQENLWMDDATKTTAEEKAEKIREYIGYPDFLLTNETALNTEYHRLNFSRDHYMKNVLATIQQAAWQGLEDLRRPVDRTRWGSTPAIVNAFYSSSKNAITFPAGILQPPFYYKGQPKAMNYGGIGAVIGHEITHGFDDQGRQFDGDGNLRDWWPDEIVENFKRQAQCIIDQYSGYVMPETSENLNGNRTQGENIADNGGLAQSYRAYRDWVHEQGKEEKKLPGLDYTPNQLFFVNYAQIWCGSYRPQAVSNQIATGVHSPNRYRVIGTLSNTPEFSEAFDCPVDSTMNPDHKCKIW